MPYQMYYNDNGNGHWIVMMIVMVVFWALVALVIVSVVRHYGQHHRGSPAVGSTSGGSAPVATLQMRFAKGEIDEAEYSRRLTLLRDEQ